MKIGTDPRLNRSELFRTRTLLKMIERQDRGLILAFSHAKDIK